MLDQLWKEVLRVDRIYPGVLDKDAVVRCYLETEQYDIVLALTSELSATTAPQRFRALVHSALNHGTEAPPTGLKNVTDFLVYHGLSEIVREEYNHLAQSAPTQPITQQLLRRLDGATKQ